MAAKKTTKATATKATARKAMPPISDPLPPELVVVPVTKAKREFLGVDLKVWAGVGIALIVAAYLIYRPF